jgi:hypothetical protein
MESHRDHPLANRAEYWIGLALCVAVVLGWALEQIVPDRPDYAEVFGPSWLPLPAAAIAAAGLVPVSGSTPWRRLRWLVRWIGLLLMVWLANGLPLDLFAAAGLLGHKTADGTMALTTADWPGLVTRALALGAVVVLARLVLARRAAPASPPAAWYGYAAFVFALPYPVLRTHWALGGTLGLQWPGAGGEGWEPLLIAIPFVLAAVMSLLLISPRPWLPRRLLLAAGWTGTAMVAMVGPAGCWALVSTLFSGGDSGLNGIDLWVPTLFYGSWFLWAIAAAAATYSYQVRTAATRVPSPA